MKTSKEEQPYSYSTFCIHCGAHLIIDSPEMHQWLEDHCPKNKEVQ